MNRKVAGILVAVSARLFSGTLDVQENHKMKLSLSSAFRAVCLLMSVLAALALLAFGYPAVHADEQAVPAVGTVAPNFTLDSQEGKPISLNSYRGKWVVLYFYPKDQTPGCTIEAHAFQRDQAQYDKRNAVVIGVSVDSVESHKEWCAKDGMNFKMLSDADKQVVATYGSVMKFGAMTVAARNTFLIDPNGTIVKEFIKVNPSGHSEQVLAALDDLQKDAAK